MNGRQEKGLSRLSLCLCLSVSVPPPTCLCTSRPSSLPHSLTPPPPFPHPLSFPLSRPSCHVRSDSPADRAGLEEGDLLVAIDGEHCFTASHGDITAKMKMGACVSASSPLPPPTSRAR